MSELSFKRFVLDNGLTIVGEVNPAAASMAVGFFARTGSRDEHDAISGVSHFLEHMMFKGTARRSPFDINREFDEMGAHYNAFTSEENTVYYAAVLPEFQDRAIDLLGDMLRPALRQEDFDIEKNVILEEIAMYEDMPKFRLFEQMMAEHFKDHPLARNVLGSRQSITDLKRDDMQAYFDRRYAPGNVTVVAVGNLNWDAFVSKVKQMCSHWQPYEAPRATPQWPGHRGRIVLTDKKLSRQHVGLASPAPSSQSADRYAAQLAATVLGDTSGSRLFYALIDTAIADDASTSYDPMDREGVMLTFISCDPTNATRALGIARDEFEKFLKEGPTPEELIAAKNKIASAATLKGELPMGRLTAVGFDWVYRGEYVPLSQQIQTLFAVSAEQVLEVARRCQLSEFTCVTLGPLDNI